MIMKSLTYILLIFGFSFSTSAADVDYMIRLCEAAIQDSSNPLMQKTCEGILKNIEQNKTKNQFICECQWTTMMTPLNDGKLCEYKCDCSCGNNQKQVFIPSVTAFSKELEVGGINEYICQGQALEGISEDMPNWKKRLVGTPFKVKTEPTPVSSDLKKKIDEVINCQ